MKKLLAIALLLVSTLAAHAMPDTLAVRQAVQRMIDADYDANNHPEKIFTPDMLALSNDAIDLYDFEEGYWGFSWDANVLDASEDGDPHAVIVRIVVVDPDDDEDADALIRYIDPGLYDVPYTLHMHLVDGAWLIDDIEWTGADEVTNERNDATDYIDQTMEMLLTTPMNQLMQKIEDMIPSDKEIADPDSNFHNNPQAFADLAEQIAAIADVIVDNPGYTDAHGQRIDALLEQLEQHY